MSKIIEYVFIHIYYIYRLLGGFISLPLIVKSFLLLFYFVQMSMRSNLCVCDEIYFLKFKFLSWNEMDSTHTQLNNLFSLIKKCWRRRRDVKKHNKIKYIFISISLSLLIDPVSCRINLISFLIIIIQNLFEYYLLNVIFLLSKNIYIYI